jgi:hypothetical protein
VPVDEVVDKGEPVAEGGDLLVLLLEDVGLERCQVKPCKPNYIRLTDGKREVNQNTL